MIRYAITDPKYYKNLTSFKSYINSIKSDFIVFRDKTTPESKNYALEFLKIDTQAKKLLNSDVELAINHNAYGVHLTSTQFDKIAYAKAKGLFVVISTHSLQEIKKAKKIGADAVTFSPIFKTPNKGEPKGISVLKHAVKVADIDIIALGGIVGEYQIKQLQKVKQLFGFASIRYFAP